MELRLSIPSGEQNPSIEVYKLAIQELEQAITDKLTKNEPSHVPGDLSSLCHSCAAVGERLKDLCSSTSDAEARDSALSGGSRDAVGNLHLGSFYEIFVRNDCSLCCLITRQFIRVKRREIYANARSKVQQLNGLSLTDLLELASRDESSDGSEDWVHDPFSSAIQVSLHTIHVDGMLSLWWPEDVSDEINDEPAQLPMIAEDHELVFNEAKPWIPLPRRSNFSERDLPMFLKAFNTCLQQHAECRRTTAVSRPTRLIDVENMRITRIQSGEAPTYFVLSYVWGRPPFLLLQKDNESDFAKTGSLSHQAIPQTISEAIQITRDFGVRFLWVDALCIVQDDIANKMCEIERMHEIYAQAELTIVAATGDGANSGLLAVAPVFSNEGVHLITGSRFTVDAREMREVVEFSTWFTRGWTFQELVFSNRLLYFTPERTYFACDVGNWSEDFPLDENLSPEEYKDWFHDEDPKIDFNFQNKLDPFENYSSMVEKISTRQFTQEMDILDACRGFYTGIILKELGASVCGLPATCFEFTLTWQPDGNLRRRKAPQDQPHFPTWSWAGWVGPINYPFLSGPKKFEIQREITWTLFSVSKGPVGEISNQYCIKQILPAIEDHALTAKENHTSWTNSRAQPLGSQQRRYGSRSVDLLESDIESSTGNLLPVNFIGPSILRFETDSITCQINEIEAPALASRRDLRFFSIKNKSKMIGELKIDSATLSEATDLNISTDSAEFISLFDMDFATQTMKDLLWMNSLSRRGTFGNDFAKMVESREDKSMRVVMWIKWEDGVASRLAVGVVTVEGFEAASPIKREIILA